MISPRQVRAARGLLNWTQADLANISGLSKAAIIKFEREEVTPRLSSLKFIEESFIEAGVEFLEDDGVKRRAELFEFNIFKGPRFVDSLDNYVVKTLKAGDTLHSIGTNEANFGKYASAANNKKFMQHVLKNNVQCQLIVPDGFRDFGCDPASYRFLSPDVIGQIYFTIYHDYLTMIDWHEPPKAIFIRSKPIAETYLRQFKFLWNLAKEPPAGQLSQWRHTWKETYLPKIFPAGGKH